MNNWFIKLAFTGLFYWCCAQTQFTFGQTITLDGIDKTYNINDNVTLKANLDRDNLPANLTNVKYHWNVFEKTDSELLPKKDLLISSDGTKLTFFLDKPVVVFLDVNYLYQTKEKVKVVDEQGKISQREIVTAADIKSPEPLKTEIVPARPPKPTPPKPTPDPQPQPILPDSQFGFEKFTYKITMENVKPEDRKLAGKLADSYDDIAKKISTSITKQAAGVELTNDDLKLDINSIISAIQQSNKKALGENIAGWAQWNKLYGDKFYEIYSDSSKNNKIPEVWEEIFSETAIGLRAVK